MTRTRIQNFLKTIVVRNPRNLERLKIARKPEGFQFEKDSKQRSYYYRAELELTGKNTTGQIRHHKDGVVLTASTKEWPIAKRLYSNADFSAASNIGAILGRRCLQAGISAVQNFDSIANSKNERVSAFYAALEEAGVNLVEPDFIEPNYEVNPKGLF